MVDGVAYFICSSCGHVLEINNYCVRTKDEIIELIKEAFAGIVLGRGIGLYEAQAIDDYETQEVQKQRREQDEKSNWTSIPSEVLQRCHGSLSFFDADGMKFHLPAFIVGSLKCEVDDPLFHLLQTGEFMESRMKTLTEIQKKAVREYLIWCLSEEQFEFDYKNIQTALAGYWSHF